MNKLLLAVSLTVLAGCADHATAPTSRARLANECVTRDPNEDCDRPSIDSISPSSAPFSLGSVSVCVYGVSLSGGTVYFNGSAVTTDSDCGDLHFTVTPTSVGTYPVYVVTPAGTTNTVYFVRWVGVP